jgi:hypothetical protein
MAFARRIGAAAIGLGTAGCYHTHIKAYLIFCILHSEPPLDPLILSGADVDKMNTYRVSVKVDNRFILFALYLASQPDPLRKKARNYTYDSITQYVTGARGRVSQWWGVNLVALQREQLGYSTFKRGLKNIIGSKNGVRLPIPPQFLLKFAHLIGLAPIVEPNKPTTWVNVRAVQEQMSSSFSMISLSTFESHQVSTMLMAACIMGWSNLLRVSEFTSKTNKFLPNRELSRKDVVCFNNPSNTETLSIQVTVKWHKTVKKTGKLVKLTYASPGGALCFVAIMKYYFEASRTVPGQEANTPCFVWPSGKPLTQTYFRSWLKLALRKIGIDESLHNTHSLRQGGASALTALHCSETFVKLVGRWVEGSQMPKLYSAIETNSMRQNQVRMGQLTQLEFLPN